MGGLRQPAVGRAQAAFGPHRLCRQALSLNARNPAALNNRGVVLISSDGEEDWQGALEGAILFRDALKQDEFFVASKLNRAALFNYYRLFDKAKQSWDQVLVKYNDPDAHDGLGRRAWQVRGRSRLPRPRSKKQPTAELLPPVLSWPTTRPPLSPRPAAPKGERSA